MYRIVHPGIIAIMLLFIINTACTSTGNKTAVRPDLDNENNTQLIVQNTLPDDKDFIGEGMADDFGDARNNAYADVIRKASLYLLGEQKYNQNKADIEKAFLPYPVARRYILGEVEKTLPEKQKRWIFNSRDSNGNLVLRLQAYVNIKKLKSDLDALGMKETAAASSAATTTIATVNNPQESQSSASNIDLSGVDISSLTFLVYYNPQDPGIKADPDQENYAKWSVDNLNRELSSLNIKTFDLETVEKLANERTLLHEAGSGSVGVGLLLAQKVFAELYAEVTPSVTYQGNRAHAIINLKVFVRTTGALIATIEKGGQQYESASLAASIKTSMREASKKIKDDLVLSLKNYVNNGRFYFVRLTGVKSYKDASKFSTAVKKIDGVVDISLKSGSKEDMVYDYNLQYKGSPTDAVDRLFEALSDKPGFEKFDLKEIRGNELTFTLE